MITYLLKIIYGCPELINCVTSTPAVEHLFRVRDENKAQFLPKEQARIFHHVVAQLLFMFLRARRDIQTPVAFLITRVRKPVEDDWDKLKRVLQYLNSTR